MVQDQKASGIVARVAQIKVGALCRLAVILKAVSLLCNPNDTTIFLHGVSLQVFLYKFCSDLGGDIGLLVWYDVSEQAAYTSWCKTPKYYHYFEISLYLCHVTGSGIGRFPRRI